MPNSPFIEAWLAGPDGHSFYTRTYNAPFPRAVAIFVHGFRDHISRHEDVHLAFAQRHVSVFAYDLRGYGRTALDPNNRSPGSSYGKTSRAHEIIDLEHWVRHVAELNQRLPLFLLGQAAGGGLAFTFATRPAAPPAPDVVALLSGVITISPLVKLGPAHAPPKTTRQIVRTVITVMPSFPFYPPLTPEFWSRDPAVVSALMKDPLTKTQGRGQAMEDMVNQGQEMLDHGWERWPKDLPVLMLWGTANVVHSPKAGIDLFEKLPIIDKKLVTYQDALDDLMHETDDVPKRAMDDIIQWIDAHLIRRRPSRLR